MTSKSSRASSFRLLCRRRQLENAGPEMASKGFTSDGAYDVTAGEKYDVFSVCIWRGVLMFLVRSDVDGLPRWCPALLFDPYSGPFPTTWYFQASPLEEISAIWGYREMVEDDQHFDSLSNQESEALQTFIRNAGTSVSE